MSGGTCGIIAISADGYKAGLEMMFKKYKGGKQQ